MFPVDTGALYETINNVVHSLANENWIQLDPDDSTCVKTGEKESIVVRNGHLRIDLRHITRRE